MILLCSKRFISNNAKLKDLIKSDKVRDTRHTARKATLNKRIEILKDDDIRVWSANDLLEIAQQTLVLFERIRAAEVCCEGSEFIYFGVIEDVLETCDKLPNAEKLATLLEDMQNVQGQDLDSDSFEIECRANTDSPKEWQPTYDEGARYSERDLAEYKRQRIFQKLPENMELRSAAWDKGEHAKSLENVKAYVDSWIEFDPNPPYLGNIFQPDFWFNRLSIKLVRAKRLKEAKWCLDYYFQKEWDQLTRREADDRKMRKRLQTVEQKIATQQSLL